MAGIENENGVNKIGVNKIGVNKIVLRGTIQDAPRFSHVAGETEFYEGKIAVPRLSGAEDVLPVLLRKNLAAGLASGDMIALEGSIRSHNNTTGIGRKLVLQVLAEDWSREDGPSENVCELSGSLCRDPLVRRTPKGRLICEFLLAVPRPIGRRDYLPVIAWGRTASEIGDLAKGSPVAFRGRFQSRGYVKGQPDGSLVPMTAYEVSVSEPVSDPSGWIPS